MPFSIQKHGSTFKKKNITSVSKISVLVYTCGADGYEPKRKQATKFITSLYHSHNAKLPGWFLKSILNKFQSTS